MNFALGLSRSGGSEDDVEDADAMADAQNDSDLLDLRPTEQVGLVNDKQDWLVQIAKRSSASISTRLRSPSATNSTRSV